MPDCVLYLPSLHLLHPASEQPLLAHNHSKQAWHLVTPQGVEMILHRALHGIASVAHKPIFCQRCATATSSPSHRYPRHIVCSKIGASWRRPGLGCPVGCSSSACADTGCAGSGTRKVFSSSHSIVSESSSSYAIFHLSKAKSKFHVLQYCGRVWESLSMVVGRTVCRQHLQNGIKQFL